MLEINNLHCKIEGRSILKGINLKINKGEIHAIMGPNGSGKSTLANVISGHEDYEITKGNIFFKDQEINEFSPEERAHEGVFMSFQYPVEIPGVTVTNFIKTAINESRKSKGLDEMPSSEMLKKIREKAALLQIDSNFLSRSLNEGFSGGEKKRNEIFQFFMEKGVFIRPLGNTIYLTPPFITSEEQMEKVYETTLECIEKFGEKNE